QLESKGTHASGPSSGGVVQPPPSRKNGLQIPPSSGTRASSSSGRLMIGTRASGTLVAVAGTHTDRSQRYPLPQAPSSRQLGKHTASAVGVGCPAHSCAPAPSS